MYDKIKIDDFFKLDIRIGEVLTAKKVPETDKLLELSVDLGEETPRTIVSGIAEYFSDPEALVGIKIPILSNLEPRTIRGIESNGMILAASGDGTFSLLVADTDIQNGSEIK